MGRRGNAVRCNSLRAERMEPIESDSIENHYVPTCIKTGVRGVGDLAKSWIIITKTLQQSKQRLCHLLAFTLSFFRNMKH